MNNKLQIILFEVNETLLDMSANIARVVKEKNIVITRWKM